MQPNLEYNEVPMKDR